MSTTLVKQGANYEQDKKKSRTTCSHYMLSRIIEFNESIKLPEEEPG